MPGKIKVKVLAGRNLPVMDRSGDTTDAYVELKFGNTTFKTDVCRKSLNPQWNSEWYRFEVDDSELQDEPLQIRLMDHDTYSANDAIGKVYINLNPLLLPGVPPTVKNIWTLEAAMNTNTGSQSGSVMTGWIPVYDTMHGIRGEVNIIVKVELFSDFNKFRQSSCGVQFFYSPNIPHGYHTQTIHGFVEELVVSDDPEYKWIDKIRTPRASNEARQTLFFKLSGEVQRKIGLKALDLGGNAVIGYLQNFDLEGESGIVARGIGTAVTLVKSQDILNLPSDNIEEAFFSQHKAQKERAGFDESMPLYSVTTPTCNPIFTNKQTTRIKKNPRHSRITKSPRRALRTIECSCDESEDAQTAQMPSRAVGLKKGAVSYPALSEAVIQDASIRMMLALEDERGEGNRNILDVRMRNLKKLFSSGDADGRISNSRSSIFEGARSRSARTSVTSICSPIIEKVSKNSKPKEGIAALLIKSIHSVPLEHVEEVHDEMPAESSTLNHSQNYPIRGDNDAINYSREVQVNEKDSLRDELSIWKSKAHESSFEENTPSSHDFSDDYSMDSANYDVLRDSNFSLDEDLERNKKFSKTLTRADTFPPLKLKTSKILLQRADSDVRPLNEENEPPLVKYVSTNQISSDLEITVKSEIDIARESVFLMEEETEKKEDARTENVTERSTDNSQDFSCPLATSTPVEIRPPFFSEFNENTVMIQAEKESIGNGKQEEIDNFTITTNDTNEKRGDDLSYVDESEVSVSAYSILHSTSDGEYKDKNERNQRNKGKRFSHHQETDTVSFRGSFKEKEYRNRVGEHDILKLSSSSQSLPSLHQFQPPSPTESNVKEMNGRNMIAESASKTSSSVESLIQSTNDIYDTLHNNRRRRMLDLMRIIDTKMMANPENLNGNMTGRRKKRHRTYNDYHITNLRKSLYNQCLRKRLQNHKRAEATRLSRKEPFYKSTPDSSSYNSSLESIITRDSVQSRFHRTIEAERNVAIKRSTVDLISHEIIEELTVDVTSNNSPRHDNIELKELKSKDTNSLPSAPMDHTLHKNRSICNLGDLSSQNECTNITNTANMTYNTCVSRPSPERRQQDEASMSPPCPLPAVPSMVSKVCQLPSSKAQPPSLHRRSSDSDLSITPKVHCGARLNFRVPHKVSSIYSNEDTVIGNSLGTNDRSMTGLLKTSTAVIRTMNQDAFEMLEYPFITMQQYPPGFILHIGGLVSSRSVKLLERISNLEEPEGRDGWWKEIRMEVRSHARALACNVVIGYREETSICDDVCVLNAYGTAAVINLHSSSQDLDNVFISKGQSGSVINPVEVEREKQRPVPVKAEKSETDSSLPTTAHQSGKVRLTSESRDHDSPFQSKCSFCHLPYNESSVPFRVNVSKCAICKRARVPDVMFTTIELPENMSMTGRGCIIQATACKSKKDLRGELNAKEISDCLPFLEYELHSLLLNKLKVKGMNAIFGLKLQVSVGERLIIGMAVGTAVFLTALPAPSIPRIASGNSWHKEEQLAEIQKTLLETVKKNREFYRLKPVVDVENGRIATSDTDESDDELPDLDFNVGTRDTCVLEVDDIEDMDRITLLMDDRPPDDFHVVNTQTIPGLDDLEIVRNLQMFTQISRTKIPAGQYASMPSKYFARLLQSVYFKLRRMIPCALCDMQFKLALPEPDEIQFTVIGMALGLGDPVKMNKSKKKLINQTVNKDQGKKFDDSDMIFNLDVDHTEVSSDNASSNITLNSSSIINPSGLKYRTRSPLRSKIHATHKHKHVPLKGRYGVDITPLSYLPGGRIERYLGNLNFFFIRESTSIRENGGLSGFTHSFVMEVLAIVRAHITALGGNAMVAFFMTKCVLLHSPHKNQGQCLINVGGDVVSVSYFADEKHCGSSNC